MSQLLDPHTGEKDGIERFAVVAWKVEDVLERRPNWTREEAADFLGNAERQLTEDMIARGWDSIDTMLGEFA